MEERYVFRQLTFDKDIIKKLINKKNYGKKEHSAITLLIMGHGREIYKENFKRIIEMNSNYYSGAFIFKVDEQKKSNSVRILSKAGKPKICAWDYSLCTKDMSSQDIIQHLSRLFFSEENKEFDTLSIMNALSVYFKKIYPRIINKISRNYLDLPEEKNPGSPDAVGYSERYEHFNQVLDSLKENKFSELKALNHEKIFMIRPSSDEEYNVPCEKYLFEIVEFRTHESNDFVDFIFEFLKIRENLVKDYFSMSKEKLDKYIYNYTNTIYQIYDLGLPEQDKYYLIKFIFKLYFGNEIMLSEIIEFFVILGVQTINIIDNTCRIKEESKLLPHTITPKTSEIEYQERIKSKSRSSKSRSRSSSSRKTLKKRTT